MYRVDCWQSFSPLRTLSPQRKTLLWRLCVLGVLCGERLLAG